MSIPAIEKHKITTEEKRMVALRRSAELKNRINDYLEIKELIKTGIDLQDTVAKNKEKMLKHFNATEEQWQDWHWQMGHRIDNVTTLSKFLDLDIEQFSHVKKVGSRYRWSISPYYASLIIDGDHQDPIRLQSIPSIEEMDESGYNDPMAEEFTSPSPCITRRYPDRLIINVTNMCAMYCRHCQRRRNIGETDQHKPQQNLVAALDYIRKNKEIRDVLMTGGDALMLSDQKIDWLLTELDQIEHVEIKRIGTRAIVTLPQRITPELCAVLKKHPPVYINTQFNHPREITPESKKACDMLIEAGVVLGNQAVLLKGINNSPHVMKRLNQGLLKIRVRPYYIFHAKQVKGTGHFITSVDEGINIMKKLRGYTSGLAVPTYIINAPNGYGKTPVLPQYVLEKGEGSIRLRTWEDREIEYDHLPQT